jgi:hypothetical protein
MRKILALSMVALLALTLAIAAFGCGKKEEAPAASTESTPMADTAAAGGMAMDSTAADTSHAMK